MRLVELPAMHLKPGMFVAELDRPWLDTPFSVQGFVIRDDDDVVFVAKHVDHVFVDADYHGSNVVLPMASKAAPRREKLELKADFAQAKITFASTSETLDSVFSSLQSGLETDMNEVKKAVRPLIESVFNNTDAVAALARLKDTGVYRFNHSIAVSIWAAIMGRHIGLPRDDLEKLVTGCAMSDIGMTQLPAELFNHSDELSEEQSQQIREHTRLGAELVTKSKHLDFEVLMIIESHHERHDGSGYPKGLAGNDIPLLARIAGLVDTYDAMISSRPHAAGRCSFDAIQELLDCKNQLFQGALVEQFIQAIGLFPVSSLVELNSGEVAIVVSQNEARRLKPEILIVLDEQKSRLASPTMVNLRDSVLTGDEARWIVRELPAGAYGLNSQEFFI
jgi:cyclic di-GMP phosphodiesterase